MDLLRLLQLPGRETWRKAANCRGQSGHPPQWACPHGEPAKTKQQGTEEGHEDQEEGGAEEGQGEAEAGKEQEENSQQ